VDESRRALVLGNTDGIGLALTRRLLGAGFTVTGVSRRASPVSDPGYDHTVLSVASPAYHEELAALQVRRGPFDVCVYCAGIGELFDGGELERAPEVMRVNLVGAVETAAIVVSWMVRAGSGHFVALSTIADGVSASAPSYSASKAGLSSWLGGLALALRTQAPGVRVTNVRLGFVDTKMAKSPVRPMMISAERAAAVVWDCLKTRPARRTYPRRCRCS
jgi:NAD(P)-dependent dehydrogenase (short-subunit alcohol dehydrogenase family)